jgi:superfamily II DNA or RNA helicase
MILSSATAGCSSWSDLTAKWARYSEKEKGYLFEELTKAYLILEPRYACKLKHVWLGREIPQAVAKKLKLPSTDYGIDIVAETLSGEFWAVQCKYRQDSNQSLTFGALSTFQALAFGVCEGFSYGLVCSTTERFSHVLKGQDRIGFCSLDDWQSLDADFFKRLRAHLAHKPTTLKPLKPRPHQKTAIADGVEHFIQAKASRGKLIMPCGSGKSLTAYFLAQEIGAKRILIAVPSLSLIRQTLKVWLRETLANRQDVDWICVCSDESAGRVDRDDVAVLRQDLGVPCLTDSEKISAWLKKKPKGLQVVFTTYQSGEALAEAARSVGVRFDLGIMDEAHKTVGDGKSLFSHLLHDGNLPIRRRLFMTATERRYAGKSDEVVSMDDPAIYGDTFHLLSFKRAMEFDPPILSDYKIISICVSREEVAKLIRKNVFLKPDKGPWSKDVEADMLASLIALRKAMIKHPIRHAVSFHSSIQRAEVFKIHNDAFTQIAPEFGDLATYHVSGATPTGTRSRIVSDFARSERALITNARCLTEGVDVPGIDCVLFADPRRSAVDIVQAVGRALRPSQGKECGYVIVPILHDENATPEDIFDSESFKEILSTLRSLAANDERIIEYFRAVSEGRKTTSRGVSFDIDERIAKNIDLAEFVREIELKCWDRLAKLSWRPFEEACAFVHCLNLKSNLEWRSFCKGQLPEKGKLPADIPANPDQTYAAEEWKGFGDWLGTGAIASRDIVFRPFEEARAFVHALKLKNQKAWGQFCKGQLPEKGMRPDDIPTNPNKTYAKSGWKNYGDWLGTGTIAPRFREYLPFEEARTFVHALKLKNQKAWGQFCKGQLPEKGMRPDDIPASPDQTYAKSGWKGMGDWLGTGATPNLLRVYLPFKDARAFVHSLQLKNRDEWSKFCKVQMPTKGVRPSDIPSNPARTYSKSGWKSYGDWLGTRTIASREIVFRPFKEARAFVRSLKLKNQGEWRSFCKGQLPEKGMRPDDIPTNPNKNYAKSGWKNYGDWLGTGTIASREIVFRPFKEARAFVRSLKLKNRGEWRSFCKGQLSEKGMRPSDIPVSPDQTYAAEEWKGFGDWLGNGRKPRKDSPK